jgi:serine/threonine protein phosphatase PrpC
MEVKAGYICDRGLNPKRPVNQDSFLVSADRGLFAVFDGVGGQTAGEVASRTAAETVEEALSGRQNGSPAEAIRTAIEFANRDIIELAEREPQYRTMATTVALAQIHGGRVTIAHLGDSRVYRFEGGQLYRETVDHTELNDRIRAGLVKPGEPSGAPSNEINRALGVDPDPEIEIKSIPVSEGSRLLLCTDGIYRHLSDDELTRVLKGNEDPQRAADELRRIVYERGADDNLTAVVVQLGRTSQTSRSPGTQRPGRARSTTPLMTAAARSRIEVDFPAPVQPGDPAAGTAERRDRSLSRRALPVLVVLVAVAGAFYAGLRASNLLMAKSIPETNAAPETEVAALSRAGRDAFELGRYDAATSAFTRLVEREPQSSDAHYWLGRTLLQQGKYADAARRFEQAISLAPLAADAYLQAAGAYQGVGNRTKAKEMLSRYVEARAKSANAPAR